MADPKVTVVSGSSTIRECADVALGGRYALTYVDPAAAAGHPALRDAAVLVCDAGFEPPVGAHAVPPTVRIRSGSPADTASGDSLELDFPFFPEALRAAVRSALDRGAAPPRPRRDDLDYPLVPRTAAAIAAKAAQSALPTLISGESGTGARRLARHIHALAGGGRFVAVPAARFGDEVVTAVAADTLAGGVTLCLEQLDAISATALDALAAWLDDGAGAGTAGAARLVCLADADADRLAASTGIAAELFYRLAVLPIRLPPLRERRDEIPAIAEAVFARLAARHAPDRMLRLGDDALAKIQRYPWPGNLAELEAVLARSLVFFGGDVLCARDLLFDIAATAPAPQPTAVRAPPQREAGTDRGGDEVDLLLHELAHELKNPMVTIKTVAQHLERLLDEESGQREMARMTGEAVDRMDRALENLLQFTRFTAPDPRDARLADVLGECFEALDAEFAAHRVLLDDRVDPGATVAADRAQLVYALENLLRAVVRAAGDGATLVVRSPLTRSGLLLEFPTSTASVTAALAKWSDTAPAQAGVAASIPFVFARALIERNGGAVDVQPGEGKTTVSIALPASREEAEEDDEEAAYPDR